MKMPKLSLILLPACLFLSTSIFPDSPHGKNFTVPCEACHSSKGWKLDKSIYSFDHNKTALPLAGQHQTVDCKVCHPTLVFSEAKTGCVDCHTDMHNQTVGPDCARCHTSKSWIVENINEIHRRSRFPLVGPHYTADCSGCHKLASLLQFESLGVECIDCHRTDYNKTTNPNHVQAGYSTNCLECHPVNSITWTGISINHSFFPLTLGHAINDCNSCHHNNYSNTPSNCVSCHQANFNQTTDPNHAALTIPTTCADCHTTAPGWKPATFAIHNNYYVLAGAHLTIDCSACHQNNYSTTLPTTCVGCHQTNYNQTNNPPHASAQYPTDCLLCHNQTAWTPSTFNHDSQYFPIYSGHHNGTWSTCGDCHTNSSDYKVFSCITCHAHNQTDMDNHHSGVSGYSYNSNSCYQCHPTGGGGGKLIKSNKIKQQD